MPAILSRYGHGTQVYDPPCLTTGATLYCFTVKCDKARMQASLDSFLNKAAPGKVHFTPLGDTAVIFFLRAPQLRSASPAYPSGFVDDFESAPSMPLIMKVTQPGGGTDAKLVNWMPYVLIGDPMGCIAGRELFGFLKGLGQFYVPTLPGPLDTFEARAQVFQKLTPKTLIEWKPLYTVRRIGPDHPIEDAVEAFDDAIDAIGSLLTGWTPGELLEVGIDLANQILHRSFPVVNLKQLPDTTNPAQASYQEISTAPMTLTAIRGAGKLKGDFEIEIPSYGSHDVAGDLGIAGAGPVYPVQFGLYINMDFSVPAGTRIWSSP